MIVSLLVVTMTGCTVQLDVGSPCEPVVINEVMTATRDFEAANGTGTLDWLELRNPSTDAEADIGGYVLLTSAEEFAYCVLPTGTRVGPGGFVLVLASTLDVAELPDDTLSCLFDFQKESERLELRMDTSLDSQRCDDITIPDQHHDYSWQRDPSRPHDVGAWCDALEPTPGAPNSACLCDVRDDC